MTKSIDFIDKEKDYWGKIFTDITYAISEISPFVEEKDLMTRRYYTKVGILKEYMTKLNSSELDSKKKSFFNMFKDDERITNLQRFKQNNLSTFKQLESCSKCQCLNCSFECKFSSCSSCKEGSLLKSCDKDKFNVRTYTNFNLDLTNNDTGEANKYKVLAVVENCRLEKLYIFLENMYNPDDKLVLYYYPGIKSDDFGEITDSFEFDSVVQAYQESDY
ncbi:MULTISPECIES: DUF1292 domain-containing protein [Clostridium]|uniref:DUF1292 domain-containing protein n=1 Tax=Clostridium cibarium TaxID=2762247 RepID=A0ABR8PR68_9CLOT|nr:MULTISPECIES: DUF1292 domain-containing protein [Clostridium]MBD7910668.1 DUF1292 domain-containing protein [Clostridium cibarium]